MAGKNKKQTKDAVIISILLLAAIGAACLLANYKRFLLSREYGELLSMDVIYNNIFVNDYEVAGLTKAQAVEKLERELQQKKFETKCIYIQIPGGRMDEVITLSYKDLGMKYDFEPAVEQAYQYARTGSAAERMEEINELENRGQFFTAQYSYDRQMILDVLEGCKADINAGLKNGKTMDIERTAETIEELLDIDSHDTVINVPTN